MSDYDALWRIVDGLNTKFPASSQDVYHFLARLTEEVGELAEQINHQYGASLSKADKLGVPNRMALAEEIRDVLTKALAIARFTRVESELHTAIAAQQDTLLTQGFLEER